MTLTVKVWVTVLPDGSVKVYVTGVLPTGKVLPDGREGFWEELPELSVDVGSSQFTVVSKVPKGTVTVTSCGKLVTTGGTVSAV